MAEQYFAKYTGIVRENRDAEGLGQLGVSVPAIFPPQEVVRARAALPYGVFFVPEVGAKVWVEFEGGEPGLPLWTGLHYVPGEWPAEARADPPTRRLIKSATGHFVLFNDRSGEERLEIVSNARIVIRSSGLIELDAPTVAINGRPIVPWPNAI
ncbi:MAG TPA: phage baseplate assembly protein V [Polyangiaceae bacterium]